METERRKYVVSRLNQLNTISDQVLYGLRADQSLKQKILVSAAQGTGPARLHSRRLVPVLCCCMAALLVFFVTWGSRSRTADQSSAIQNISVTLSLLIIKFSDTYKSTNSRYIYQKGHNF